MAFRDPPRQAAWRHVDARTGFEVMFARPVAHGWRLEGRTAAVEAGESWTVGYAIDLAGDWTTRGAQVSSLGASGRHEVALEADGAGRWRVDGAPAPHLDGCLDVDLESSALTNAFPAHRLGLEVGQETQAPAAYVRAPDLTAERLEQRYLRLDDEGSRRRYHYAAPAFGFECRLVYDASGLVLDYPGIAVRAA